MDTHNKAFQNSLRCLQHPLSLISITVLLLNDHVFKIINPSWLTGKLSDFAGLFFFPFIVAVFFSLLFKFKITTQRLGQMAFGVVAIWFVLIKTSHLINSLTSDFASVFINRTAQIILDPTDLIALIIMFPAWKLWDQPQKVKISNRLAYITLAIGAIAAVATSPREVAVSNVTDLVYSDDGIIYAADRETFGQESYPIAKSFDGGLTWERDFDSLPSIHEKQYPIQVCNSRSEKLNHNCYRVTSTHQLERFWNESWVKVFPSDLSVKAYDIIIFTVEGNNYMLIAIGETGVLRRDLPDGNWEIIPVIYARSH